MRDINVYGFIGDGWDETDMTATKFANELKEANGEAVTIHVNSGGGDVFDANTMAELLRAYQASPPASSRVLPLAPRPFSPSPPTRWLSAIPR